MQTYNLNKLMARKPTLIGQSVDVKFYEHPTLGEDAGLIAVCNGKAYQTDFCDLPDLDETIELKMTIGLSFEKRTSERYRYSDTGTAIENFDIDAYLDA